ncbi:MAG: exo-alpha-sialidase [Verrucomicrobia bacterium]|nr:exo-alpha-sialidase [Verrucomicrobiota bacterium]
MTAGFSSLIWSSAIAAGLLFACVGCVTTPATTTWKGATPATDGPVLFSGFVAENPPFPESHASTLVETSDGVMAAWFGGTHEKHPDVCIWTARFDGRAWSAPTRVADGVQADGTRHPCWNPVLHQPKQGPLLLFYKVGPSPSRWWGMIITSRDAGRTWSTPRRLPEGQLGPIRNKPVVLPDGSLLCPSSTEDDGWRVQMERTPDLGATWERSGPLNSREAFGAIQPTILQWPDGRTQILNRSRQKVITECWMKNGDWRQWTPMERTQLPNPNSGIDATVLHDGRGLLVFNDSDSRRTPISVALSADGKEWRTVLTLEDVKDGELSYPAVIQTRDQLVHISYTWKRKTIRHVILDPRKL